MKRIIGTLSQIKAHLEDTSKEYLKKYIPGATLELSNTNNNTDYNKILELLKNFPEWNTEEYDYTYITNIGVIYFKKSDNNDDNNSTYVLYDPYIVDENLSLSNIEEDISMLKAYNELTDPLCIRRINFDNNGFLPISIVKYTYEEDDQPKTKFQLSINADKIYITSGEPDGYTPDDYGLFNIFFDGNDISTITISDIQFNYKQNYWLKLFDSGYTYKYGVQLVPNGEKYSGLKINILDILKANSPNTEEYKSYIKEFKSKEYAIRNLTNGILEVR